MAVKDKKSTEIFKSTKLSQFKINKKWNREIDEKHLNKLKKAISKRNLLIDQPILINEKKEVLDGQHRLMAAKELKLPIYYRFSNSLMIEDVPKINTIKKSWGISDYIKRHIRTGNKNYIRLQKLWIDSKINPFSGFYNILDSHGGINWTDLQEGRFIYPADDSILYEKIKKFHEVAKFFAETENGTQKMKHRSPTIAIIKLINDPQYNHSRMLSQFRQSRKYVFPSHHVQGYFEQINKIYNFGKAVDSPNKVDFTVTKTSRPKIKD